MVQVKVMVKPLQQPPQLQHQETLAENVVQPQPPQLQHQETLAEMQMVTVMDVKPFSQVQVKS